MWRHKASFGESRDFWRDEARRWNILSRYFCFERSIQVSSVCFEPSISSQQVATIKYFRTFEFGNVCLVWFHSCLSDFPLQCGLTVVPVFFQVVWEQQEPSCTASVPSIRAKPGSPSCWWEDASLLRALLSSLLLSVCLPQLWNPNSEDEAVPYLHPDQPWHRAAQNCKTS